MSVNPTAKARLETIPVNGRGDPSDRQNLADTEMAGQTSRHRRPDSRPPSTMELTPATQERDLQLTPLPNGESWFVRTGAMLNRRTFLDDDDPPPPHGWTRGKTPFVLAGLGMLTTLILVAWLALA